MADIYLLKGENDQALALAEKGADLAPNDYLTIWYLAWQPITPDPQPSTVTKEFRPTRKPRNMCAGF